jgi:hypothetical protein
MNRQDLILPDPSECSQRIAEAIYDIRIGCADAQAHKLFRNTYGTEIYYMLAVETVYDVNGWTLTPFARKLFRKSFRSGK